MMWMWLFLLLIISVEIVIIWVPLAQARPFSTQAAQPTSLHMHAHNSIDKGGAWSMQEDQKLIDFTQAHGGLWRPLPSAAGLLRSGKIRRLRRTSCQRPDAKRSNFSEEEDDLIIKLHALLGNNRWPLIAGRLPGRTDDEIKNHWNSRLKWRLASMGIDPNNHRVNQCISFHRFRDSLSDDAESNAAENCKGGLLPDLNLELTISSDESST